MTYSDGTVELRAAGSRAWRNNNPGNMRNFPFSTNHGSIGGAGGFAVFPSEAVGMRALQALLGSSNYANLTVNATIARFAPPTDGNNTAAYQTRVQTMTGIAGTTVMSTLTTTQLNSVSSTIKRLEGWNVGTSTWSRP